MMTARRVPLIDLVGQGDIEGVQKLIKEGCNVDETDYCGGCAVIKCVERNDITILQELIAANAKLEVIDPLGISALSLAEELGHHKIARLIEEALAQRQLANNSIAKPNNSAESNTFEGLRFYPKGKDDYQDERKDLQLFPIKTSDRFKPHK